MQIIPFKDHFLYFLKSFFVYIQSAFAYIYFGHSFVSHELSSACFCGSTNQDAEIFDFTRTTFLLTSLYNIKSAVKIQHSQTIYFNFKYPSKAIW